MPFFFLTPFSASLPVRENMSQGDLPGFQLQRSLQSPSELGAGVIAQPCPLLASKLSEEGVGWKTAPAVGVSPPVLGRA